MRRYIGLGAVLLVLAAALSTLTAHAATLKHQKPLRAQISGQAITQGIDGGPDTLTFTVVNKGRAIGDFGIKVNYGDDSWTDHHVVTGGSCQLDTSFVGQHYLRCGPIAAGATATETIDATFKGRGNFSYEAWFADRWHDNIAEIHNPKGKQILLGWQEAVS